MTSSLLRSDIRYPRLLAEISGAPAQIFYRGEWRADLFEKCLAVVGSRRMTRYGRQMTDEIVSRVAAAGITIVSGFMYGVDATAHRAALKGGGRTIAVMPCGIDLVHPEHQEDLHGEIMRQGGLIISEFAGTFAPTLWTYPKRNRIVAGLCQATLVVEAGLRSGSLITARHAMRFGRILCAVPGNSTSPTSEGTNLLLKEGARFVTNAGDVLELFGVARKDGGVRGGAGSAFSATEEQILDALRQEPCSTDDLALRLSLSAAQVGSALSMLQIAGCVEEEEGRYYAV